MRNPVLALPAMTALRRLDPSTRAMLRRLLLDLQTDARGRAETSWARRKPPMAAYRAAVAVYAGHIARALGPARAPARPPVVTTQAPGGSRMGHGRGEDGSRA